MPMLVMLILLVLVLGEVFGQAPHDRATDRTEEAMSLLLAKFMPSPRSSGRTQKPSIALRHRRRVGIVVRRIRVRALRARLRRAGLGPCICAWAPVLLLVLLVLRVLRVLLVLLVLLMLLMLLVLPILLISLVLGVCVVALLLLVLWLAVVAGVALRVRGVVCAVLVALGAVLDAAVLRWTVVVALVWIAGAVRRLLRRAVALRGILVVALLLLLLVVVLVIVRARHLRRDDVALLLVSSVDGSLMVDGL